MLLPLILVLPSVHSGIVSLRASRCNMVGRKVLDGLRKGKKDLYALNVQYVKRYHMSSSQSSFSTIICKLSFNITYYTTCLSHAQ